ncbi:protein CHROMATIN REMODELING 5 [Pelomyxa schiedti]|nr:protein CHROMATIN REMODELING 5 [Pelomyxa schiedti]
MYNGQYTANYPPPQGSLQAPDPPINFPVTLPPIQKRTRNSPPICTSTSLPLAKNSQCSATYSQIPPAPIPSALPTAETIPPAIHGPPQLQNQGTAPSLVGTSEGQIRSGTKRGRKPRTSNRVKKSAASDSSRSSDGDFEAASSPSSSSSQDEYSASESADSPPHASPIRTRGRPRRNLHANRSDASVVPSSTLDTDLNSDRKSASCVTIKIPGCDESGSASEPSNVDDDEYFGGEPSDSDDYDDYSDHSSGSGSGSDFGTRPKRRKVSPVGLRTSLRCSTRKSYKEDDDDDDEEDDGDFDESSERTHTTAASEWTGPVIERVLDHRPIIVENGPIPDLKSLHTQWEKDAEYLIKWKDKAYIHNTWETHERCTGYNGFKKLQFYIKQQRAEIVLVQTASADVIEQIAIQRELHQQSIVEACKVERIVSSKSSEGSDEVEYLIKWRGLPYQECTWELPEIIQDYPKELESFLNRERAYLAPEQPLRHVQYASLTEQPSNLMGGLLRDYQLDGLNWLTWTFSRGMNGILADEMGLGKTVQAIAFLLHLHNTYHIRGPHLIVVPLSTITNWAQECEKWAPSLNTVVYAGVSESRKVIREHEFYGKGHKLKFNIVITNYELVLKDKSILGAINWRYLIVDEAHRLKNSSSQLHEVLKEFKTGNRLLITGTPLQNSLGELWSLLNFLMPNKFFNLEAFEKQYSILEHQDQISHLHQELKPYLLRRLKRDVEKSLPQKKEQILRVDPTPMQRTYYKWILTRNFGELNKNVKGEGKTTLLNIVVDLKKLCNHPYLFPNAENPNESQPLQALINNSGKMILLDKLLVRLYETKHRVLIFSQMVKMLEILADYLHGRGWHFQRLDGSMTRESRQQAMDHFNAEGSTDFCFLLSTRAGGLGINLVTADTVIIFDSDWNPQNDLQAQSRCHRIGQEKVVNIYRLLLKHTVISLDQNSSPWVAKLVTLNVFNSSSASVLSTSFPEESILLRAKQKMVLDHLVIQSMDTTGHIGGAQITKRRHSESLNKEELEMILKFNAEDIFKQEKEAPGEMDLDEVLARAETTTEQVDSTLAEELLNTFKVTSFATQGDEFWSKLITPDVKAEMNAFEKEKNGPMKEEVSTLGPRQCVLRAQDSREDRRKSRHSSRSNRGLDMPYNEKEVRLVLRGIKKFGDASRINDILTMNGKPLPAGREISRFTSLGEELTALCFSAVESAKNEAAPAFVDFGGANFSAKDVVDRLHDEIYLKEIIAKHGSNLKTFRLPFDCKSTNWQSWGPRDDALLLLGVHRHGIGNWDAITADKSLGLGDKCSSIKAAQLQRRVDTLFRYLRSARQENVKPNSSTSTSKSKRKRKRESDNSDYDSEPEKSRKPSRHPPSGRTTSDSESDNKPDIKTGKVKKHNSENEDGEGSEANSPQEPSGPTPKRTRVTVTIPRSHISSKASSSTPLLSKTGRPIRASTKNKLLPQDESPESPKASSSRTSKKPADRDDSSDRSESESLTDITILFSKPLKETNRTVPSQFKKQEAQCQELLKDVQVPLKKLRYFTVQKDKETSREFVVSKSSKYLLTIGQAIEKIVVTHPTLEESLWHHVSVHTARSGPTVKNLYIYIRDKRKKPKDPPPTSSPETPAHPRVPHTPHNRLHRS